MQSDEVRWAYPLWLTSQSLRCRQISFCVGMDVDIPSGVKHHRCGFKAIAAQVSDLLGSTLFVEVLESSIRFLDAVGDLEEKFEHLAAAEVVEVFLMRGISCHDAIFARHQPTSMFWLRTASPAAWVRGQCWLLTYMRVCSGSSCTSAQLAQTIHQNYHPT